MTWIKDYYTTQKRRRMAHKRKRRDMASQAKQAAKAQGRPLSGLKLPSVSVLGKKLAAIISEGVKIRDKRLNNGLCLTCNAEPIYAAGHIIPDSDSLNTRYDPLNLYGVGRKCNFLEMTHRSAWARMGGIFWAVFGPERMIELNTRAAVKAKWGRAEFAQKIEEAKLWLERILLGENK